MRKSRLSRKYQKKSTQTLILSILGIAAVLFLLFRYGIPLLSDASFLFGRITGRITGGSQIQQEKKDQENYVPPPDLDPLPKATKEQDIKVTGSSLSDLDVVLFLNGAQKDKVEVSPDGTFEFNISLTEGENIIKVKGVKNSLESEFSDSLVISYKKEGPSLSIDSPKDGETVSEPNPYNITGKVDPDTRVTVNDFQAIISAETWTYALTLKDGENEIKVVAIDSAGNKTEKIIKINYSP